jgi:ribA/ribD-fused uncharacterized protein
MTIYFYEHTKKYGFLSNFYKSSFTEDERTYCCSEQYFMKKKQELFNPLNLGLSNRIMMSTKPSDIKRFGRQVKNFREKIWNEHKFGIMRQAVFLKFSQNPELEKLLIQTGDNNLAEASPTDRIWGIGLSIEDAIIGADWRGENLLGQALVSVREELKNK